jgi:hypothetical protein
MDQTFIEILVMVLALISSLLIYLLVWLTSPDRKFVRFVKHNTLAVLFIIIIYTIFKYTLA